MCNEMDQTSPRVNFHMCTNMPVQNFYAHIVQLFAATDLLCGHLLRSILELHGDVEGSRVKVLPNPVSASLVANYVFRQLLSVLSCWCVLE